MAGTTWSRALGCADEDRWALCSFVWAKSTWSGCCVHRAKKHCLRAVLQPPPQHDALPLLLSPISAWGVSVCWLIWVHCLQLWIHEILWDLRTQLCVDTQCPWVPFNDSDTSSKDQSEVLRLTGNDWVVSLLLRVCKCSSFLLFI